MTRVRVFKFEKNNNNVDLPLHPFHALISLFGTNFSLLVGQDAFEPEDHDEHEETGDDHSEQKSKNNVTVEGSAEFAVFFLLTTLSFELEGVNSRLDDPLEGTHTFQ